MKHLISYALFWAIFLATPQSGYAQVKKPIVYKWYLISYWSPKVVGSLTMGFDSQPLPFYIKQFLFDKQKQDTTGMFILAISPISKSQHDNWNYKPVKK